MKEEYRQKKKKKNISTNLNKQFNLIELYIQGNPFKIEITNIFALNLKIPVSIRAKNVILGFKKSLDQLMNVSFMLNTWRETLWLH